MKILKLTILSLMTLFFVISTTGNVFAEKVVIDLVSGWNLVGVPVTPVDPEVGNHIDLINKSADLTIKQILKYDNGWKSWTAGTPDMFQSFLAFEPGVGYWIKTTGDGTGQIIFDGATKLKPFIGSGWHLLAFPTQNVTLFQNNLPNDVYNVKQYLKYDSGWKSWTAGTPDMFQSFLDFESGAGYWVKNTDVVRTETTDTNTDYVQFQGDVTGVTVSYKESDAPAGSSVKVYIDFGSAQPKTAAISFDRSLVGSIVGITYSSETRFLQIPSEDGQETNPIVFETMQTEIAIEDVFPKLVLVNSTIQFDQIDAPVNSLGAFDPVTTSIGNTLSLAVSGLDSDSFSLGLHITQAIPTMGSRVFKAIMSGYSLTSDGQISRTDNAEICAYGINALGENEIAAKIAVTSDANDPITQNAGSINVDLAILRQVLANNSFDSEIIKGIIIDGTYNVTLIADTNSYDLLLAGENATVTETLVIDDGDSNLVFTEGAPEITGYKISGDVMKTTN